LKKLPPDFIAQLTDSLGNNSLYSDPADCWAYGYDNSRQHSAPDLVVFPATHDQVKSIVSLCNTYKVPLVARGRGTGTAGACVPVDGGVVISFERMDKILNIDPDNRVMEVQPGVTNTTVQTIAGEHGFFWAPDPTSADVCTVGGNLAYNSAGPRAVKYGTPRENVLGLRAVTGAGEEIRTGVYTTKGVVGYDFTRLLIGSEGTLAIITEAILKLLPKAEAVSTLLVTYKDIHHAARAISAIMAQPVTPCALEFMDAKAIDMIRNYSEVLLPDNTGAILIIEVDGESAALENAVNKIRQAASNDGLISFIAANTKEDVDKLWQTRKALSPALRNIAPKKINEDIVVPVSKMPELIEGLDALSARFGITIVNFGHAGNGNVHVNLLADPDDPEQMEKIHNCLNEVFNLVLKLKGTLSGEHGVGIEKRDYIAREIDPVTLNLMKRVKRQFDPDNILNPGKMFPA